MIDEQLIEYIQTNNKYSFKEKSSIISDEMRHIEHVKNTFNAIMMSSFAVSFAIILSEHKLEVIYVVSYLVSIIGICLYYKNDIFTGKYVEYLIELRTKIMNSYL